MIAAKTTNLNNGFPVRVALLAGAAAATGGASLLALLLDRVTAAGILSGVAAALFAGRIVLDWKASKRATFLVRAAEQAETGRQLAIYDRETGLFAYWYMAMRYKEECDRALRYGRPLTLLFIGLSAGTNARQVQSQVATWLKRQMRQSDVTGYMGYSRFVALIPETDNAGTAKVVERLSREVDGIEIGTSVLPDDGRDFEAMFKAASHQSGLSTPLPA